MVETTLRALAQATRPHPILALLICTALAPLAVATDYSAEASFDVRTLYNNNLRMTEDDKTEAVEYRTTPTLELGAETETTTAKLTSLLYFKRYDEDQFNSDDQTVQLNLSHEFEASSAGLNGGMYRDSTVTSEILSSGIIGETAERTIYYSLAPYWTYTLNEQNMLQFQGSYGKREYRNDDYTGYESYGGNVDWIRIFNERWKFVLSAKYSDVEFDERTYSIRFFGQQAFSTRTKEKGLQVGLDHQWSENTMLQLRLGSSKSDQTTSFNDLDNICTDPTYLLLISMNINPGANCSSLPTDTSRLSTVDLSWNWKTEVQEVGVNASKSTQPSSNGYVVDSIQLSSYWKYRLTERDRLNAELSVVRNRSMGSSEELQSDARADRDYQSATLGYRRQLSENWYVNTSYQYNWQKYSDIDYAAESHVVSLGIHYQPQSWHWAR